MKHHFLYLVASLLMLSAIVAACDSDDDSVIVPEDDGQTFPEKGETVDRTVLVYMVADNNLGTSGLANADIEEMKVGIAALSSSLKRNNNLLVYVDNSGSTPVLYRVIEEDGLGTLEVVKDYGTELTSTDVSVLKQVIADAYDTYPADSYGMVYWSHGEGWTFYSSTRSLDVQWIGADWNDSSDNSYIKTDIEDLAAAIEEAAPKQLEYLMFDACYMLTAEVAYDLRYAANYLIGCPTEVPGPGAPYKEVIARMFDTNNAATAMADAYYQHYADAYDLSAKNDNSNWTAGASIGVLDLSYMDEMANVVSTYLPDSEVLGTAYRGSVFDGDKRTTSQGHIGYYDMNGLMELLLKTDGAESWARVFDNTQIYWNTTEKNYSSFIAGTFSMEGASGLAHFMPTTDHATATIDQSYHRTSWYNAANLSQIGW